MRVDDVRIQNPCHEDWSGMDGQGPRRFCDSCARDVHDLSAMSEAEARTLVQAAERGGARLCVRYSVQHDGKIRFQAPAPAPAPVLVQLRARPIASPATSSRPAAIARAGLAAALLAACTPHGDDPKPCGPAILAPADDDAALDRRSPVLPEEIDARPTMGEMAPPPFAPPPPPPPPSEEPMMGALAPEPPPPPPQPILVPDEPTLQAEIAEVRMGDVASPSSTPTFAPPPPPVAPAVAPHRDDVKMGKMVMRDDE